MGLILGYLCLICMILLLLRYPVSKKGKPGTKKFFSKIHKPLGVIFLILTVVHLILVFPVLGGRHILVNLSGFLLLFLALFLCLQFKAASFLKLHIKSVKWHHVVSLGLLLILVVHMVTYFIDLGDYWRKMSETTVSDVDLTTVADGTYEGSHDVGYVGATVRVTVKDHQITDVDLLEHKTERGAKAEVITGDILKEQKVTVDAVSSATNSSTVIKKAVENALLKGSSAS